MNKREIYKLFDLIKKPPKFDFNELARKWDVSKPDEASKLSQLEKG